MIPAKPETLPQFFFMTDETRCPDPESVVASLAAGTGVIFRNYDDPARADMALRLAAECRRRKCLFLVAGDPALARRVGADGLHLPEWALRRPLLAGVRPGWIITAAAHNIYALSRAAAFSADAVLLAPVFQTASHPGADAMGLHKFQRLAKLSRLPVYALGGVTRSNVESVMALENVAGAAGISMFE